MNRIYYCNGHYVRPFPSLRTRRKNKRYTVRRIKYDMYTVYHNRRTATYNLYALGTSIPRVSEDLHDIVNILHALVNYKREKLPGAFSEV